MFGILLFLLLRLKALTQSIGVYRYVAQSASLRAILYHWWDDMQPVRRGIRAIATMRLWGAAIALRGSVAVPAVRSWIDSMGRVGRGCRRVFPAHVELEPSQMRRDRFAARRRAHSAVLGRSFVGSKNGTRATSASTSPSFGSSAFTQVPRFQCARGIAASAMLHPTFGDQKALVT